MSCQDGLTRPNGLIVAVDGPSGAGKTTLTRFLAERLGYIHIDTGAMFRAVALEAWRNGVDSNDEDRLAELCTNLDLQFVRNNHCCRVLVHGDDVTEAIRTPEITKLTSAISARKSVRAHLLQVQRVMGASGGVVMEGRDIGTVVFPDAEVKFFLSASAEERGRRRFLELQEKGESITMEETIVAVMNRDRQDERRDNAPLCQAEDAILIDSTGLPIEKVLDIMEGEIKKHMVSVP